MASSSPDASPAPVAVEPSKNNNENTKPSLLDDDKLALCQNLVLNALYDGVPSLAWHMFHGVTWTSDWWSSKSRQRRENFYRLETEALAPVLVYPAQRTLGVALFFFVSFRVGHTEWFQQIWRTYLTSPTRQILLDAREAAAARGQAATTKAQQAARHKSFKEKQAAEEAAQKEDPWDHLQFPKLPHMFWDGLLSASIGLSFGGLYGILYQPLYQPLSLAPLAPGWSRVYQDVCPYMDKAVDRVATHGDLNLRRSTEQLQPYFDQDSSNLLQLAHVMHHNCRLRGRYLQQKQQQLQEQQRDWTNQNQQEQDKDEQQEEPRVPFPGIRGRSW